MADDYTVIRHKSKLIRILESLLNSRQNDVEF